MKCVDTVTEIRRPEGTESVYRCQRRLDESADSPPGRYVMSGVLQNDAGQRYTQVEHSGTEPWIAFWQPILAAFEAARSSAKAKSERSSGGKNSGKKRRAKAADEARLIGNQIAALRKKNPALKQKSAARIVLRESADWHVMEPAEQDRAVDNLLSRLRRTKKQ